MAKRKQPTAVLKVLVTGGQANPAPPLGPTLSQHRVYRDGSFDFEVKTPPASYLIKRAAGIAKGSGSSGMETAGTLNRAALRQIAEQKMEDLNTADIEAAMRVIEGTARSCGVEVTED